jgi:class 3 adenylate cyclase/tetratricopeptide (TPR) repeat protein
MRCSQCQQDNPPGARFCSSCGARLAVPCPACGHTNAPGSRFCNACGQPLAAPARFGAPGAYTPPHLAERILAVRQRLEGERKQVTVLFADLKGSMELLADRDPEDARKLLDPVLERMMAAVHRYEGTVNQVLGDGVMALFGAPLAHEDHAVRACFAALAMQESVGRYGDETQRTHGVPVQIRIGLNSGEVVVRSIGSDLHLEYTALGQTTHLAARMEQMAKPGSVLLTADTLSLAEGFVHVRPLGPVPIRGLADPVEVFELAGAIATRTRLEVAATRGLTRFVGREAELAQLREALEQAGAGRGQVVAIVGDAGVGKSRLVWELRHSHRADGWLVLQGSAVAYGKATSHLPVAALLKGYFHVESTDDTRCIREKLTGKLLALDEALRPTLPALQALFEVPVDDPAWAALDPPAQRRRTVDAVKALLLRESRVQPALVVLEDLHWIDPETQAILDGLVESLPAGRVLLVVNYRPEYQHAWGGRRHYRQIRLDPLPPETAEGLLRALAGDDPALRPLTRLLIDRTQGNPLFLEESVRSLVELRALVGERGAYHLAPTLPAIQIPATVQALLAARIDRLEPADKRLLQTAAVVGAEVPLALLQAVADLPEGDLQSGIARLQAAEFLHEARLFPEPEYAFAHALTQEVAYGSLLHERRRELHGRTLAALERLHPERVTDRASRLAHHAFRGEVWGKAIGYLRQSLTEASRTSLDAALGGPDSPGTLWWTGEHERAIAAGQRDLAIAANFRNFAFTIVALCRLGQAHHAIGEYARAADFFRRAAASLTGDLVGERCGMAAYPSVMARAWLAWSLAELGEFDDGIAHGEEAVALAEALDDPYSRVIAAWGLGTLRVVRGDAGGAIPLLERGLAVTRMHDFPLLVPFVAPPLGAAYALDGRGAEAVSLLADAAEQADGMTLRAHQSLRLTWLGEAHLGEGRLDRAAEMAAQALALAEPLGERGNDAAARRLLAEVAGRRDPADLATAAGAGRDALARAEALGMRPLAARGRLTLGLVAARAGAAGAARAELRAAIEPLRSLGMTRFLAMADAALAELG